MLENAALKTCHVGEFIMQT